MKELSIEEKAKRYDEAIKVAKRIIDVCVDDNTECRSMIACIQQIFPELKDSEDERIRKELIFYLGDMPEDTELRNGVTNRDVLSWLEKQGDKDKLIKELGEYKVKYTQEVLEKHINSMSNKDDERLRMTTISFLKDFAEQCYYNVVECIDWLVAQWEQNLANSAKTCKDEQKPVLSEEDERAIGIIKVALEHPYDMEGKWDRKFALDWIKEHKKQLTKPQNTWKPSDEQMKQLSWIAEQNKNNMIGKELMTLYQDLKKLRVE